jgi:upstream activation factor subunit UAF30
MAKGTTGSAQGAKPGKPAKKGQGGSSTDGLRRALKASPDLEAVIGKGEVARADAVSKIWEYIKKNDRQNPENKREILADDKLKKVFGGKDKVTMFEMNKHLSNHLSAPE